MTNANKRMTLVPTPLDSNKRQDNLLWLQMWQQDQIGGFHQPLVNPLLVKHWPAQGLRPNSRILVPLCGKSLDMIWLAQQGHKVVGIELSPLAVKAFFRENNLQVRKMHSGNFTCWKSANITIWCGDFFSLQKQQLGPVDCVLDRAALTALPESIRAQYVQQLRALIDPQVEIFLLTVEDVTKHSGVLKTAIDDELIQLFSRHFDIRLTHADRQDERPTHTGQQACYTDSKVYQLSQLLLAS
ncbi:thiopurine S-methyltransferase [Oceanobacter mangrovi]|uniref:thiopurine S-methyltransferase n=1 Tax=Oceanobacter mangrovi TaxID=2862510 RepID=UPI001C8E5F13|nr:thiopurine S-methyltransferase [Oceanobacter mangrovi]